MRAVVLCGGLGTRLHPYTVVTPKPLVPINDKPILDYVLKLLIKNKFNHITLALNHQAALFIQYINNYNYPGIKIDFSLENKKLGTMGPLKLIKDLPENFIVMNADILTNINVHKFFKNHLLKKSLFSICYIERQLNSEFGVLYIQNKSLINFKEKPSFPLNVSTGIYCLNKKVLKYIPNKFFGFDDLVKKLLKKRIEINTYEHKGLWLDIGRQEDYINSSKFIKKIAK